MIKYLKKLLPLSIKERIISISGLIHFFKYRRFKNLDKAFVFLACDYKNIGDAAITFAQCEVLKKTYPNHEIIEIPLRLTVSHLLAIKLVSKKTDIITIIGGGHFGDLYSGYQRLKNKIVTKFPDNYIISFPQSFNFDLDNKSSLLRETQKSYQEHKNLLLMMRDEKSFSSAKNTFPKTNVVLVPDVVLTQDFSMPRSSRSGVQIILRNDVESVLNLQEKEDIQNQIKSLNENFVLTDTLHKEKMLNANERNVIFNGFIKNLKSKSLIVTDRLHAVIFCYITKTPCIAINSHGNKVKNAIDTFMKCDYILVNQNFEIESFKTNLKYILSNKSSFDFNNKSKEYFESIFKYIKEYDEN